MIIVTPSSPTLNIEPNVQMLIMANGPNRPRDFLYMSEEGRIGTKSVNAMRQKIQRERRKGKGKMPRSIKDIDVKVESTILPGNINFLLYDKKRKAIGSLSSVIMRVSFGWVTPKNGILMELWMLLLEL